MKSDNRRHIIVRYGLIIALILLVSGRIVYKLVDTTIVSADRWNQKVDTVLVRTRAAVPLRGNILACDGSILASSVKVYTPRIDFRSPRFNVDTFKYYLPALADSLAAHFPRRTAAKWREYLSEPLKKAPNKRSRCFPVLADISHYELRLLKTFPFFNRLPRVPNKPRRVTGLYVEERDMRVRPYGVMARRSIGAVGVDSFNNTPHGKFGLEKALDSLLAGHPGVEKQVQFAKGIKFTPVIPAVDGYDVYTTIDIKMQDIVERELNNVLEYCLADWGVAVLMEVSTGDIKAIANLEKGTTPGSGYIESMNRAALGYEPGSVIKTLSMMIALEDGIVTNLGEVIPTGSSFSYGSGRPVTDSHYTASLRVDEVLEQSSNIAMSRIITRRYGSNPGAFYSRIKKIGFFEPMHTGIAGELIPRIDSLQNTPIGRSALARQSYGYTTEVSPIYMASIYNAIANGGRYVRPRLIRGYKGLNARGERVDTILPVTYIRDRICSEKNAAILREMLTKVVWGDHGTARNVLRSDKVRIAGKTGTANTIENGVYIKGRNRLAFCGIFPADKPLYTCMVLISHPRENWMGAASTSGRVVRNVAESMYSRGMLQNSSDFTADAPNKGKTSPVLYASTDATRNAKLQTGLKLGSSKKVMNQPKQPSSGVPNVVGLGLRDAIRLLEHAGYSATITGNGFVAQQMPSAGEVVRKGTKVQLILKTD